MTGEVLLKALIGGIGGLAFGSAVAYFNYRITRRYARENNGQATASEGISVLKVTSLRMFTNIAALATVYLLRNVLPLPFAAVITGTAVGLSMVSLLLIWHLSHILERG
ncbi:MAG: hypothetical protein RR235_06595 [Oscillospiraceae bacterium]